MQQQTARGLVIVGNFLKVGGDDHQQVAIINLVTNTVMPWASQETESMCGTIISLTFSLT